MHLEHAIADIQNERRPVGLLVRGLSALVTAVPDVWLIVKGRKPLLMSSRTVDMSFEGVTYCGRTIIRFDEIGPWERDDEGCCIAFEIAGDEAVIAPATADEDACIRIRQTVERFVSNCVYDHDTVYVRNLDSPLGARLDAPVAIIDDEIHVIDHRIPIQTIVWAKAAEDGDGNRYLHLVLGDGSYLCITAGDLGR